MGSVAEARIVPFRAQAPCCNAALARLDTVLQGTRRALMPIVPHKSTRADSHEW